MKITVKGYSMFARFLEADSGIHLEMDAATLLEALIHLSSTLGEDFRKLVFIENSNRVKNANLILLNGQNYLNLSKKLATALKDGDEISLLPMITGG